MSANERGSIERESAREKKGVGKGFGDYILFESLRRTSLPEMVEVVREILPLASARTSGSQHNSGVT